MNDLNETIIKKSLKKHGLIELNQVEIDTILHSNLKVFKLFDKELSLSTTNLIVKKFQQLNSIEVFDLFTRNEENKLLPQLGRILERNCSRNLKSISFDFDTSISNKIIQLLVKTIPGLDNLKSFFVCLSMTNGNFLTSSSFSNLLNLYSKIDFYYFGWEYFFNTKNSIFLSKVIKNEHDSTSIKDFLFCCNLDFVEFDIVSIEITDTSLVEYKNLLSIYLKSKHTVAFENIENLLSCDDLFESLEKEVRVLKKSKLVDIIGKEIIDYMNAEQTL